MAKKPITDYKKLKSIWDKKLEKSGFVDIETKNGKLKDWSSKFAHKERSLPNTQSKLEYYRMAENFLNEYTFESTMELVIWEYHTNAISARDITKILAKAKIWKTNRTTIWQIIKNLEDTMKNMYLVGNR